MWAEKRAQYRKKTKKEVTVQQCFLLVSFGLTKWTHPSTPRRNLDLSPKGLPPSLQTALCFDSVAEVHGASASLCLRGAAHHPRARGAHPVSSASSQPLIGLARRTSSDPAP